MGLSFLNGCPDGHIEDLFDAKQVLRRTLEICDGVDGVRHFPALIGGHCLLGDQIRLIAHQYDGNGGQVCVDLGLPFEFSVGEGDPRVDTETDEHHICVRIAQGSDPLVVLLTRGVP